MLRQGRAWRRRPAPNPVERQTLSFPNLPDALDGLTFLHLTDLHIRRRRPWYRALQHRLARTEADFILLTGDYMSLPGDEQRSLEIFSELVNVLNARIGIYASFGNHDTEGFKRLAMREIRRPVWLEHDAVHLAEYDCTIVGSSTPGDLLRTWIEVDAVERAAGVVSPDKPAMSTRTAETAANTAANEGKGHLSVSLPRPFRIFLGHEPPMIIPAAHFGIDWMTCGHTHGGQFRFGLPTALHNSTDFPGYLSSGVLRLRDTIATVSRGLGESILEFRLFCDRQLPLYTLRRGPLPGEPTELTTCLRWW